MFTHPLVNIVNSQTIDGMITRRHVHFQPLTPAVKCNSIPTNPSFLPISPTGKPRHQVGHHTLRAVDDVITAHFSLSVGLRPPDSTTAHPLRVVDEAFNYTHRSLSSDPEPLASTSAHPLRANDDAFNLARSSLSGKPRHQIRTTAHRICLIDDATVGSTTQLFYQFRLPVSLGTRSAIIHSVRWMM